MHLSDDVRAQLHDHRNVIGVGQVDDGTVSVFVTEKLPATALADEDIVPATVECDGEHCETNVIDCGVPRALAGRKSRHRPAPAGVSTAHEAVTAGTLGSPLLETEAGETVFLTNAHVAAPTGEASPGDTILQPGPHDGGASGDEIGTLLEFSEIDRSGSNKTDSALVDVSTVDLTETTMFELGDCVELDADGDGNTTYTKSGRTTGVTEGERIATDVSIEVRGYYPNEPVEFVDVDAFSPMSAGGDSGSLIGYMDDGFHATHLLFAGSPQVTFAIPLDNVFDEHGWLNLASPPDNGGGDDDDDESSRCWLRDFLDWLR